MADHLDLQPQFPAVGSVGLHRVTEQDWRSHRDLRRQMLLEAPDAFWVTHADVADWGRRSGARPRVARTTCRPGTAEAAAPRARISWDTWASQA
ncbi:hypothetical protein [Ornithinicoccus halotolerans]|uniref:hypothetical protein n=1 Tax=Ornithinicoccus halotolerans TaxID=1748220 RepID=UPI0012952154|nr:hypothetical protein [Ornithinicoccus halotolerans]